LREQRFNFTAEIWIIRTSFCQEFTALLRLALERRIIKGLDALPAFGIDRHVRIPVL
jgi:hypothetical protein